MRTEPQPDKPDDKDSQPRSAKERGAVGSSDLLGIMVSRRSFVLKSLKASMLLMGLGQRYVLGCFGYLYPYTSKDTQQYFWTILAGELRRLPLSSSPESLRFVWNGREASPPGEGRRLDWVDLSYDTRMTPNT